MTSEPSIRFVSLTSELFQKALDQYVDYNKPDPLSRKQLETWSLQWIDDEISDQRSGEASEFLPDPSHALRGRLEIGGEYIVISLKVECMWKSEPKSNSQSNHNNRQYGELFFTCHATARFWTKSELKERRRQAINQEEIEGENRNDKKVQDKIRSKMVARLRDDAYVSKLLVGNTSNKDASESSSAGTKAILWTPPLLAQAKIRFSVSDLEERVKVSEDVCEAIKRAIWASAESPLDVVEVLLHMPFLPTTTSTIIDQESSEPEIRSLKTPLANRAKLRLLEDAMCDACEKEGEEELLDDLNISDAAAAFSTAQSPDNSQKIGAGGDNRKNTSSRKRAKGSTR